MEATKEQYLNLYKKCEELRNDKILFSFQEINFVDYTKYLIQLKNTFPTLLFIQRDYGIIVERRK